MDYLQITTVQTTRAVARMTRLITMPVDARLRDYLNKLSESHIVAPSITREGEASLEQGVQETGENLKIKAVVTFSKKYSGNDILLQNS